MYHEITVWTRGIIMDKEARDIVNCVATGAEKVGHYAQFISDYIDDPDRTNCLVHKYARFGDEPIVDRFVYENANPDWVVLVEETLVKASNFFRGTPDGEGVLVVNSAREPEYLLKYLPDFMLAKLQKVVVVDAVALAEQEGGSPWMFVRDLGQLAYDRTSTEGAAERSEVGIGVAAPLLGALIAATGVLPLEAVQETVRDKEAFARGAKQHKVLHYAQAQVREAAAQPI